MIRNSYTLLFLHRGQEEYLGYQITYKQHPKLLERNIKEILLLSPLPIGSPECG